MEPRRKKPKPFAIERNSSADDLLNKAMMVVGVGVLLLGAVVGYHFWKSATEPEMIKAVVYLDNRCEIMDDAFVLHAEPNGATSHFSSGRADIWVPVNGRLIVKSSPRYPAFKYETHKHMVKQPYTVITTNCGDRIDKTMDAMREQFRRR
jgi:hypothetical protein